MTVLQTALCNLKDQIMLLGYFNRFYELAELIERGQTEKFPQVYLGNGQYKQVYDFDVNGMGYIRKTSPSSISIVRNDTVACADSNPMVDVTIPLRLVCAVPKKKLNDNSFSDDMLAFELLATIGRRQPAITSVQSVTGRVNSYLTDRDLIWSSEVRGIDKQVDLNLSFIAVDFNLIIRANVDCLEQNCDY